MRAPITSLDMEDLENTEKITSISKIEMTQTQMEFITRVSMGMGQRQSASIASLSIASVYSALTK